jgi:methylated-DNA-[protein]-cysteine S-methyltransferase
VSSGEEISGDTRLFLKYEKRAYDHTSCQAIFLAYSILYQIDSESGLFSINGTDIEMNQINIKYYKTSYGELVLGSFEEKLCMCDWRYRKMRPTIDMRLLKGLQATSIEKDNELLKKTRQQLSEYFNSKRQIFDIPLLLVGTEFQKNVWKTLLQIPFGTTSSYLALTEKITNKKAVRAVANANGANAISILIPCHRIIGIKGELVGYAGGLQAKKKLLKLEQDAFSL